MKDERVKASKEPDKGEDDDDFELPLDEQLDNANQQIKDL